MDVPNLRFPEFTEEWKNSRLGDSCDTLMCKRIMAAQTNPDNGVPFYKIGTIGATPDAYISQELFEEYKHKYNYPKQGEVMITCAGTVGKCIVFDGRPAYYQDSNIVWIDNPTEQITNLYLYNFLSKVDWSKLNSTTIIRIYNDDLRNLKVSYPSTAEQIKICKLLSLIDERITTQKKIIEKLQSLIVGLTDSLITSLLDSELYPFSTLYSKAGEGGTPMTSNSAYYKGGTIPFIKIDDLSSKYLVYNKDFITDLGMQKSSAWLIPPQSVIYSNGATIGAISINKYPVCTKQGILGIVPNNNVTAEYLYLLMTSTYFSTNVERIVTEGTMKTAYLKDINHIKCPLPTLEQQKNMTKLTSSMDEKLSYEQDVLKLLHFQKQYLLTNMFI